MFEIVSKISSNFAENNTRNRFGTSSNGSQNRQLSEESEINESFAGLVTSFTVYKLLTELVKKFTELEAYKAKLIDANGNYLKRDESLSKKEKQILSPFNRLVIGIKRLIASSGSSKLKADFGSISTAAKAMALECASLGGDETLFLNELQEQLTVLMEEGEIGNVVGGGIAGGSQVGTPNSAIAGLDPPMGMPLRRIRRKSAKERLVDVFTKP